MRLVDLLEDSNVVVYHATDRASAINILSNGFTARGDAVWFNESPDIGMDDAYTIKATVTINKTYHYDTDGYLDPDDPNDVREMISLGYDSWQGASNVGAGDDIVVFDVSNISLVSYFGKRVVSPDYTSVTFDKSPLR